MFADFSCFEAIGRDARELSKKTSIFRFSFYELFLIYFCEVGRIAKRKIRRFRNFLVFVFVLFRPVINSENGNE